MKQQLLLNIFVGAVFAPISGVPLSKSDTQKIGMQIWFNEASQKEELLVFWHEREAFPSLGIGHAIWLPQGSMEPYTEQFPALCTYLQKHGVQLPAWLECAKTAGAPWKSRAEFLRDTEKVVQLRKLLASTIDLQTSFMIEQLQIMWPLILEQAPRKKRAALAKKFNLLQSTPLGMYALVDYLNFKGAGTNPREESNGNRWGLLQVVLDIPDDVNEDTITKAFAVSAAKILVRRIEGSAPDYPHLASLPGWINRVSTYADPYRL